MNCERCADEGWIETCRPDGSDCRAEPCTCDAGDDWSERAEYAARKAADPHERAAARSRACDFEDAPGQNDWT